MTQRPTDAPELDQPTLTDGRIGLRPWRVADAEAVVALCQDADILRWTGVPDNYTVELAVKRMEYADQLRFRGEALLYAIDDAASGQLLGAVDLLLNPRDPGIGEIAYMLGAHARGRGVMTAAVRLLCAHVFDNLGVRRVELLHHPDNHASAAVAVRAGFVREGVLRAYRVKKTHVAEARLIYSLLDTDV